MTSHISKRIRWKWDLAYFSQECPSCLLWVLFILYSFIQEKELFPIVPHRKNTLQTTNQPSLCTRDLTAWFRASDSTLLQHIQLSPNFSVLAATYLGQSHYKSKISLWEFSYQIFKSQFSLSNIFEGLRSRCMIFAEWRYFSALRI